MSPHERFMITSFVLTTKQTASIMSIDRLGYIAKLDPCLYIYIKFKSTQDRLRTLVY